MRPLYVVIAVILAVVVLTIIYSFFGRSSSTESKDLSQVIANAKAGDIKRIEVRGKSSRLNLKTAKNTPHARKKARASSRRFRGKG